MGRVEGWKCDADGTHCKNAVQNWVVRINAAEVSAKYPNEYEFGDPPKGRDSCFRFDCCEEVLPEVIAAMQHESTRRRHRRPAAEATEPEAGA